DGTLGDPTALIQDSATRISYLAASSDGKKLAALCGSQIYYGEIGNRPPRSLKTGLSSITSLALSPDGRLLAAAGGRDIWIAEISSSDVPAQPRKSWHAHADLVTNLAFSSDGKFLASGGKDAKGGSVKIWSLEPKTFASNVLTLNIAPDAVSRVRFSA